MSRIIALFPGQGSQKVGMGADLVQNFPLAQSLFDRADKALGIPLSKYCFEGPEDKLTLTEITQPAILTTSVAYYEVVRATIPGREEPVCAAGHSLGEYSALVAAEALTFEDAVVLVNKRGRYMQQAVPVGAGKMVAVIGKDLPDIETAIAKVEMGIAQVANVNSPGQVVVAGDKDGVNRFMEIMAGARLTELSVSAPFHCKLMKPAEDKLREDLAKVSIRKPKFPVISNYHARPLTEPEEIREALALQVCGRVRWVESMEIAQSSFNVDMAVEFGAGAVLTGLLKRIKPEIARANYNSAASVQEASATSVGNL